MMRKKNTREKKNWNEGKENEEDEGDMNTQRVSAHIDAPLIRSARL